MDLFESPVMFCGFVAERGSTEDLAIYKKSQLGSEEEENTQYMGAA